MKETFQRNSSDQGAYAAEMSKNYIRQRKLAEIKEKQLFMSTFVESYSNASKANKLGQLLNKQWNEIPNSYKLLTKID